MVTFKCGLLYDSVTVVSASRVVGVTGYDRSEDITASGEANSDGLASLTYGSSLTTSYVEECGACKTTAFYCNSDEVLTADGSDAAGARYAGESTESTGGDVIHMTFDILAIDEIIMD